MKLSTLSAALASALFASVIAYADPKYPQAHEADGIAAVMAQLENPPESAEHKAGVAQLQQLAEAGNPRAMIRLGERLEKGTGVDDFEYALAYYRRAVEAGYWHLYRYNPDATPKFTLDSKAPTMDYEAFLEGEVRYAALRRTFPENAKKLFAEGTRLAKERYEQLKNK